MGWDSAEGRKPGHTGTRLKGVVRDATLERVQTPRLRPLASPMKVGERECAPAALGP